MTPSQIAVNDIGNAEDFLAAIEGTIKNFNELLFKLIVKKFY
jgi:small subunit ribosomal protein S1